jgi:hypothetical protein
MRTAKLGIFLTVLALIFMLVACAPQAPKQVTLEYDATLYVREWDADGDPVERPVGTVPKGAVCTYANVSVAAGEAWVAVEKCTLNGQDYGDGLIGVEMFKERETLYKILNSR